MSEIETEEPLTAEQVEDADEAEHEHDREHDADFDTGHDAEADDGTDLAGFDGAITENAYADGIEPPPSADHGPQSERDLEKAFKKIGTSANTYRRAVDKALGEDAAMLVACELCLPDVPGYHFEPELMRQGRDTMDETGQRLLDVLLNPASPDYLPDQGKRGCDSCGGYGKVRTGSKVPGQEIGTCSVCAGFGFVPPPGALVAPSSGNTPASVATHIEAEPAAADDSDPWGSPRILPDGQLNPNFGKMPQYKDANLP